MLKTGTISQARISMGIAETNGFTCSKFLKTAGIVLEQIKSILESGDDILIARQQNSSFPVKASGARNEALALSRKGLAVHWGRNQALAGTGYCGQERLSGSSARES